MTVSAKKHTIHYEYKKLRQIKRSYNYEMVLNASNIFYSQVAKSLIDKCLKPNLSKWEVRYRAQSKTDESN